MCIIFIVLVIEVSDMLHALKVHASFTYGKSFPYHRKGLTQFSYTPMDGSYDEYLTNYWDAGLP